MIASPSNCSKSASEYIVGMCAAGSFTNLSDQVLPPKRWIDHAIAAKLATHRIVFIDSTIDSGIILHRSDDGEEPTLIVDDRITSSRCAALGSCIVLPALGSRSEFPREAKSAAGY